MYYNKIEKNENNKNMHNYTQKLWNVENYGILQVKTISLGGKSHMHVNTERVNDT